MFFTPVCHSVHRGCLADTPQSRHPPEADTPLRSRHPLEQTPPARNRHPLNRHPRSRHPFPEQTTYPEQTHTPEQTPTPQRNPPIADPSPSSAATEADSTHHTGMHSCSFINFDAILVNIYISGDRVFQIWNKSNSSYRNVLLGFMLLFIVLI